MKIEYYKGTKDGFQAEQFDELFNAIFLSCNEDFFMAECFTKKQSTKAVEFCLYDNINAMLCDILNQITHDEVTIGYDGDFYILGWNDDCDFNFYRIRKMSGYDYKHCCDHGNTYDEEEGTMYYEYMWCEHCHKLINVLIW